MLCIIYYTYVFLLGNLLITILDLQDLVVDIPFQPSDIF